MISIESLVVIVIMLILSAFFSGMELAFLNKNRLKLEIDRKQSPLFNFISNLFSRNQGQYITTILVGNNITLVVATDSSCGGIVRLDNGLRKRLVYIGDGCADNHSDFYGGVSAEVDCAK